jgi:hypothetical protein
MSLIVPIFLVSLTGQVVGKTLDGRGGVSGNLRLAVVTDDDGLFRLGDGNTEASL